MMYFEGHFTQEDLDETLRGLGSDVFFVQIGANDGIIGDPISHHVKALKWRGLLVEPMPDVFAQLKSNYAMCNDLQFENVAITGCDNEFWPTCADEFWPTPGQTTGPLRRHAAGA